MKLLVNKLAALDNTTSLYAAIKHGTSKAVKLFIETDVNDNHNNDDTPLHYAAKEGKLDVVRFLLNKGIDVNEKQNHGITPLHLASRYNDDFNVVKLLIDNGADVNAKTNDGATPLHYSAQQFNSNIVILLLDNGADVNTKNNDEYTSLHFAASGGSLEVVKLLLKKGADVSAKAYNGENPLDIAYRYKRKNIIEFFKRKLEAHQNRHHGIQMVASSATKTHSFIRNLFGLAKNLINPIYTPALPSVQREDTFSPLFSQVDINHAISSFGLVNRRFREEYTFEKDYSAIELMEERIDLNAICVINNFEKILKSTDAASNINEFMKNFKASCNSNGNISLFKNKAYKIENSANSQIGSSVGPKNSIDYISLQSPQSLVIRPICEVVQSLLNTSFNYNITSHHNL